MPEELPSPEFIAQAVGYGVVLPAIVTALVLFTLGSLSRIPGRVAGAIAFLAGFLAGWVVLCKTSFSKPLFQFEDEWQWLPVWVSVAVVADLVDLLFRKRRPIGLAVRCGVIVVVAFVAAEFLVSHFPARTPGDAPPAEARPQLLNAFRLAVACFWFVIPLAVSRGFPVVLLALSVLFSSMVLELGGTGINAQLAGLAGGVLLGCASAAWWKPDAEFTRAMVPGVAVALPALLFNGYLDSYSTVPLASYALAGLASFALLLGLLPFVRKMPFMRRSAILLVAILLPLGVALTLALKAA